MAAAFVTQILKRFVALDAEDDFLEPALFAGAKRDLLDLPTFFTGVVGIHGVKIAGEDGGFVAAGAGADFDDDALVILAGAEQQIFETFVQRFLARLQFADFLLGEGLHVGILLRIGDDRFGGGEFFGDFDVVEIGAHHFGEGAVFLAEPRVAGAVRDHLRIGEEPFQFRESRRRLFERGPHGMHSVVEQAASLLAFSDQSTPDSVSFGQAGSLPHAKAKSRQETPRGNRLPALNERVAIERRRRP